MTSRRTGSSLKGFEAAPHRPLRRTIPVQQPDGAHRRLRGRHCGRRAPNDLYALPLRCANGFEPDRDGPVHLRVGGGGGQRRLRDPACHDLTASSSGSATGRRAFRGLGGPGRGGVVHRAGDGALPSDRAGRGVAPNGTRVVSAENLAGTRAPRVAIPAQPGLPPLFAEAGDFTTPWAGSPVPTTASPSSATADARPLCLRGGLPAGSGPGHRAARPTAGRGLARSTTPSSSACSSCCSTSRRNLMPCSGRSSRPRRHSLPSCAHTLGLSTDSRCPVPGPLRAPDAGRGRGGAARRQARL